MSMMILTIDCLWTLGTCMMFYFMAWKSLYALFGSINSEERKKEKKEKKKRKEKSQFCLVVSEAIWERTKTVVTGNGCARKGKNPV